MIQTGEVMKFSRKFKGMSSRFKRTGAWYTSNKDDVDKSFSIGHQIVDLGFVLIPIAVRLIKSRK